MKTLSQLAAVIGATSPLGANHLKLATNPTADDTVTVGTATFTFKAAPAADREVDIGADADASAVNLADAINAEETLDVYAIAETGAVKVIDFAQRGPIATTETLTAGADVWDAATTLGGPEGEKYDLPDITVAASRTVTAAEATATRMIFGFNRTPKAVGALVRTAAGVNKAWDGKLLLGENHVELVSDAAADLAENDVVFLLVTV